MNDIENGMAVGAQEEFDRLSESHWEDDRDLYLMEKYADDRDLVASAVTRWLGVENGDADYDKCLTVFDSLAAGVVSGCASRLEHQRRGPGSRR